MVEHFEGVKSTGLEFFCTQGCITALFTELHFRLLQAAPPAPHHPPGEVVHGMEKSSEVLGVMWPFF